MKAKILEVFIYIGVVLISFIVGLTLGWIGVGMTFAWFFADSFFMKYMISGFEWKNWFELRLSPFAFVGSLLGVLFYTPTM